MTALLFPLLLVFPMLVVVAALTDVTSMTIPNWVSGALLLAFFPAAFATGLALSDVGAHVGVFVAALALAILMFALRWIGGGDAKLMAAVCLWLGLGGVPAFLLWTALAGGVFALSLVLARQWLPGAFANGPRWVGRLLEPKGDIPYGVAICVGALAAFPHSPFGVAIAGG
jgi:prepilin peptidase CpaA